jgi:hypothetical protein
MYEVEMRDGTIHRVRADSEGHAVARVKEQFGELATWRAKVREITPLPGWRTRSLGKDLTGSLR